jgi:putative membrane-bound dehydrogenase-like protein
MQLRRALIAIFLPITLTGIWLMISASQTAADAQAKPLAKGLSPKEELATFHIAKGFRAELVACEPNVVDPVAINFDEDGRMYVTEMPGYPNDGVATGTITSGRIKLLEDLDGDGFYEQCTLFADRLRLPTCAMPWNGGVLVAVAPDVLFLKDTDGDGKANSRRTLYTGFDLSNSEQLIDGLQWGLDNWVYGCAGTAGGTVRSVEKADQPAVALHGRGVRFHPEQPGSLEPTSGGGQYGLASDDWQQWFVNTNNQHLRHIVLPDHYLRRNPWLPVSAVTLDIPDHGPACKVERISPFEAWRVERTRRRREHEAQRFPATELVPGGYVTSGCSPVVYTGDIFPESYRGNTFICDPANNLIHRDILVPHGATFIARRDDTGHEFMASTDNWFRPAFLTVGPDGALYVADFYREIIETPLSLPDDFRRTLNLDTCGKGRIWRIVPEGPRQPRKRPALSKASTEELVHHLADANSWWRLTAQRLLVERQDRAAVPALANLAKSAVSPQGRVHAVWTLHGLHALNEALIKNALKDSDAHVREQALRMAEGSLAASADLRSAVAALADDPAPRVRFQLAFTLGEVNSPETAGALAKIARRDGGDPWTQTAILSSCRATAPALLETLAQDKEFTDWSKPPPPQLFRRLAALVGARGSDSDLAKALALVVPKNTCPQTWQAAILEGLGQGLQNSNRSLSRLWEQPPPALQEAMDKVRPFFQMFALVVKDSKAELPGRLAAAQMLGYGPDATALAALQELLAPQNPAELQLAGIRALSLHENSRIADLLLASWSSYSPAVRREVVEVMFARSERLPVLLKAIREKKVLAGQLEPFRLQQLRKLPNRQLRAEAVALLAGEVAADRQKIVETYRPALALKGDAANGKTLFKKTCSTCHRLENGGTEVGPDLLSALRTKTREGLLIDIFDPSREVDPRYINYIVTNKAGRVFTGMVAAETASSITLRRAEKAEDTILRTQIDEIQATAKSLMPENLELQLSKQDVADLIAYLRLVSTLP